MKEDLPTLYSGFVCHSLVAEVGLHDIQTALNTQTSVFAHTAA